MGQLDTLLTEARELGLFRAHGAFEVHCGNCHSRLDAMGDCASCGLIGRPESDVTKRAQAENLLRRQIARRRAYRPVKAAR